MSVWILLYKNPESTSESLRGAKYWHQSSQLIFSRVADPEEPNNYIGYSNIKCVTASPSPCYYRGPNSSVFYHFLSIPGPRAALSNTDVCYV